MATDYRDFIQLSYNLYSTESNEFVKVMTNVRDTAKSVTPLHKSANFDECEIFDLFGVNFAGNTKGSSVESSYDFFIATLPSNSSNNTSNVNWKGHPMLKSYVQDDERLAWND